MTCGCVSSTLLLFFVFFPLNFVANGEETKSFAFLMPDVSPQQEDTYLCTSIRVDANQDEIYITSFGTKAKQEVVHHLLLSSCSEPGSEEEVWDCEGAMGPKCKANQNILYVWAKDAPKLNLPEGVGFQLGGKDAAYLVLQVHYATVEKFKDGSTDNSGVVIEYTKTPQPKSAGVMLLGTGGRILPHSTEFMETACHMHEDVVIHPFAFRTHTHDLGRIVSGYKVEKNSGEEKWTLIGKKDPQLPQMFYPVANTMTISKGDIVAARCTMESKRKRVTRIGATSKDEMCNFYIMYWTDNTPSKDKVQKSCFSPGPPLFYWDSSMKFRNIPEDASLLPAGEMSNKVERF